MRVHAMVHVHILWFYIAKTTLPLLQRPRKHGTTVDTFAEHSSFHDMLSTTQLAEWTPIPLQSTSDEIEACFLERN